MILDAATEPPSAARADPRWRCAARLAGVPTLLRWSRRSAADVLRSFFHHDALLGPALVAGPMVWGISPETPGTGLGALSYAMRHVGHVGRPVGGSGAVPTALRARVRGAPAATLRTGAHGRRDHCATATRSRGVALADGTEITAADRGVGVRPARHVRRVAAATRRRRPAALVARWRASAARRRLRVEARRRRSTEAPVAARRRRRRSASTLTLVAPSLAEMDRGGDADGERRGPRPAGHARQRADARSTRRWRQPGRHVFSLEVLLHAVRAARAAGPARPSRSAGWSCSPRCASPASSTRSATGGR